MYRALFIDDREMDNLLNALMVREEKLPLDPVFINNAQDALEYLHDQLEEDYPHFIFIDMGMPVMNGIEFLEAYNERFADTEKARNTTLCFLSSSVSETDREKAMGVPNATAFYNKPINKTIFSDLLGKREQ